MIDHTLRMKAERRGWLKSGFLTFIHTQPIGATMLIVMPDRHIHVEIKESKIDQPNPNIKFVGIDEV